MHAASDREITFGDIVSSLKMPVDIPKVDKSDIKPATEYRYLGGQVMRRDVPAKSNGSEIYGMDIQVPGMAFASVLRCPVEGGWASQFRRHCREISRWSDRCRCTPVWHCRCRKHGGSYSSRQTGARGFLDR